MNDSLMKKKVFWGLIWKFGERITAQGISLVVSIILARILGPNDYGIIALVMVFISIANVFVSGGFGNALVQKKGADNLDFSSVFYINIAMSVVIYFLIYITAPYISDFYNMSVLCPALRVLGIRIIIAAINSIQQAYVSREMLFKRFFWSTLFGTLVSGVIGVYLAYAGYGVWALVIQYLTNTCVDTVVLWFTVRWRPMLKFSWQRARELIAYGWKILASNLLDTGYNQMRSMIIGKVYTSADLAFYNQAEKYPSVIVTNVNTSISTVLFPAISLFQDDKIKVKQMTRRAIQVSSYVMWPLMIGLAVVAESLVKVLLTEKWLPCVPYLRIFCISYGLYPIHTANLQAINAQGRSDLFLKMEIIKKICGVLLLIGALRYGVLAMAGSVLLSGILSTFINSSPNRKLLGYTYKEQLEDILPSLFMALIMAFVIYPIKAFKLSNELILLLQIVLGGVIYVLMSILTKQTAFSYLVKSIKKN